jgi:hypothetical protein
MAPARIKIEHYIPRFLLSEFRIPGSSKVHKVWCFDKHTGNAFPGKVKKVCGEQAFYDLGTQEAERAFAELESSLSQCHRALIKAKDCSLLAEGEKEGLAVLIATQHMRTRAFRNTIREASKLAAPASPFIEEDPAKLLQFHLMDRAAEAFVASLLRMKWVLLVNETESPFWFSDNPFAHDYPIPYDPHDGKGFEREGTRTYFPLSPALVLSIVDPSRYDCPAVVSVNTQEVIFNNYLQVINSERFIISREEDFTLARKMISEKPGLRDPSQGRFNHLDLAKF